VDPRAGLDDMEKRKFFNLPGLELSPPPPPGRPARSKALYRLSYPGSIFDAVTAQLMYSSFRKLCDKSGSIKKSLDIVAFKIMSFSSCTFIFASAPPHPMGTGGSFPGVKQPGYEADHLPPRLPMSRKC
jgi:hypothetical protein